MSEPLVLLVGMHRSGTSALAHSMIRLFGWQSSRLVFPSNPDGQWERAELRPALDLLLAVNGATWSHPPRVEAVMHGGPFDRLIRRSARRHLQAPGLWKDPRLCLTCDYWLELLAHREPRVVFIHREPFDVALSLQRRNGFPIERGLALWERTVRNALVRLQGRDLFVVNYQTFCTQPESTLRSVASYLELDVDEDALADSCAAVRPALEPASIERAGYGDEVRSLCPTAPALAGIHGVLEAPPSLPAEPSDVARILGTVSRRGRLRAVVRGVRTAVRAD